MRSLQTPQQALYGLISAQDASADRFKALSEAYSTLGDPEKRSSYDATLSGSSRPRRRHSSPRPTYSTSDDGSFGPRTTGTSAGSRAWQTDKHTRSAWQEAEAAARLRNRTARYAAGIGRTYHHPAADPVSDLERELARTAEYERRHRTLGRSMKGGVDESPFTGKRREEGADWTSTAPWVMTAVMMYGLLSWWMRRPVRMRGEEEAVQR